MATTCPTPATGANSSVYYVKEEVCGVTPENPVFKELRRTSGNMQLTKDTLESNELDGNRDRSDVRLGQNQASGEFGIEMSFTSHDDFYAAAIGGEFTPGQTQGGLNITVDPVGKTFSADSGDFTLAYKVGDLVSFAGLTGNNAKPFVATEVTATVLTAGNLPDDYLEAETGTSDALSASTAVIDDICTSFTILENYPDLEGGPDIYTITRGVKVTGWSFTLAVNSNNTGSFSMLGLNQEVNALLPAGATFEDLDKTQVYSGVDGTIYEGGAVLGYVNSADSSLDTEASAQFALGNDYAAFIEQGRVLSSLTLGTFFTSYTLLEKFINETPSSIDLLMESVDGSMLFSYPRVKYTSGTPDVSGSGSITQSLDALPVQTTEGTSSIVIQIL